MPTIPDSKNVLITGASGLIGTALARVLADKGYQVYALERNNRDAAFQIDTNSKRIVLDESVPLSAVINLAGSSIAEGRWTERRKQQIWDSRIFTTELLCKALTQLPQPPEVLVSASAIGFYGNKCNEPANEDSPPGDDFLASLSIAWERAADHAALAAIRTVKLRFGLVLSEHGGVLGNLVLPLKLAVVGRLGSGRHLQSWISLTDTVAVIVQCIENQQFSGPLNVVAPEVLSNREFARTLSDVLARPQLPPLPATVVRLMFGELADAALLASSNITSTRLTELGIEPQHSSLREALKAIYS